MTMKRRDFIRVSGIAAAGSVTRAGYSSQVQKTGEIPDSDKGIHPVLEKDHPYIFIDSCMQIWPDAQFEKAHRHGVTASAVTAWDPHIPLDQALEGLMYWHLIARRHPPLLVATRAEDIEKAKREKRAAMIL